MIKLEYVPNGLYKIRDYYGGPPAHIVSKDGKTHIYMDVDWYHEYMRRIELPFPLRLSFAPDKTMRRPYVHMHIADALKDALKEILEYGGYEWLKEHDFDMTAGIHSARMQRGANKLSAHAWGAAIDYCPNFAPYGEKSRMPFFIHEAFIKRGFVTFPHHDGQHFQAMEGY